MSRPKLQSQFAHSPVMRYGLAVASFAIALGLALLAQRYGFRNVEVPLSFSAADDAAFFASPNSAITVFSSCRMRKRLMTFSSSRRFPGQS